MVLRNEVSYKLTKNTNDTLVEYHKKIHYVDAKANTYDWTDKEQQCKKLQEESVQDINGEEAKDYMSAPMKTLAPPPSRNAIGVVPQPTTPHHVGGGLVVDSCTVFPPYSDDSSSIFPPMTLYNLSSSPSFIQPFGDCFCNKRQEMAPIFSLPFTNMPTPTECGVDVGMGMGYMVADMR
ncbi:uncharacterized protein FIESC28_00649 [Fusarium coffeatum]|uniref:Uncharacterized protein n=1 Tax=Fusarium coffeatum TaxID=231269 RepID=A0A366SC45_9HYPO|nr:uncharacterized protein FIESC28_00649 [Fusarium coffeatum]RBR26532.1 hypothetical protein FIESC28_00649 [Fusarium coffeatum]